MSSVSGQHHLPQEWTRKLLSDCAVVQTGVAKGRTLDPDDAISLPYLRVANVQDGFLDLEEIKTIDILKREKERYMLHQGDVLLTEGGDFDKLGRGFVWNGEIPQCVHQNHVFAVRLDRSELDPAFFSYQAQSSYGKAYFLSVAHKTTNLACINTSKLKAFPVLIPPLPEQLTITHILSAVQRAIEAQERIIQTTTELKKALMHKLFTEGLRGEPHRETEIGLIPESWEVVKLGEVAHIERGKFSHRPRNEPRFYGGEYPFVQTGDVSNCDGYVRSYTQTLNEDGIAISKMFPAGTILITIAANIGFTGILEFDSACPDSLIGITPNEIVHTDFLNYYLITQQPEMDRLAPKGTQKNINIQFLKPWPVPLPPVEEQKEIAGAFSATDRKIRVAYQKRSQLQDLFRTLLHELMTAKRRVNQFHSTINANHA